MSQSHVQRHPPMVTHGLSRGQFAKIVFPSALMLIIFIAYSILIHIYSLNLDTKQLPMDAILFCIIWTLLLLSFLRGAFSSPGLVEKGWYKRYPAMYENLKNKFKIYKQQIQQQQEWMKRFNKDQNGKQQNNHNDDDNDNDNDNDNDESTKLLIDNEDDNEDENDITFPDNFARPPRSHFCHELQSNVLRMDHFCVWFNNAVGFYNYKYFLLTIIYLFMACLLSIYILIYRLFINHFIIIHYGIVNTICLLLTLIICIFFIIFSGMHCSMHLWQMTKNLTSIEYHKYLQIKSMAQHFQIDFPDTHEFDDGVFKNCQKMLGYDIWFWLIPIKPSMLEDGYKFNINMENKQKIENVTKAIQSAREQLWKSSKLMKK